MAKYKLINQQGYSSINWKLGEIYKSTDSRLGNIIASLVKEFPKDWELIKENNMSTEKTITLTLDKAKSIYGKNMQMDELLLANFSKEELTKEKLPDSINSLRVTEGYKITNGYCGNFVEYSPGLNVYDRAIFATKRQAISALAMAQLSQLMAVYNDGWTPNWLNPDQTKYVIYAALNKIDSSSTYQSTNTFLAFKSLEIRNEFLANFQPLIKQYFMID